MRLLLKTILVFLLTATAGFVPALVFASDLPSVSENAVLQSASPKFLDDLNSSVKPDSQGAIEQNRASWSNIVYQRVTDRVIAPAVVRKDPALVEKALKIADFAFAHQTSDGGFSSAGKLTIVQQVASEAFFIQDFAHSSLLLQRSTWFENSASTASLRDRWAKLMPNLRLALQYLSAHRDDLASDAGGANRLLVYAGAFYLGGTAINDSSIIGVAGPLIDLALNRQAGDGTFLELGGFDSSYQSVSLYQAQLIYLYMSPSDPRRAALWGAITRGFDRQMPQVQTAGRITTYGNTRIGLDSKPALAGGPRHNLDSVAAGLAFTYYAGITSDQNVRHLTNQILAFYYHI